MHTLKTYLDSLPRGGVGKFADSLGISRVYLSQLAARQDGRVPSAPLCVRMVELAGGELTLSALRPDDYWLIWPDLAAPKPTEAA